MQAKDAGVWKNTVPWAKHAGAWKEVQEAWRNVDGTWQKFWENALYSLQMVAGYTLSGETIYKGYANPAYHDTVASPYGYYANPAGGSLSPLTIDGHGVLESRSIKYGAALPGYQLSIASPNTGATNWMAVRTLVIAGRTIPGRFVKQRDVKTGEQLNYALFVPGATDHTTGNLTVWDGYQADAAAIYAALTPGSVHTILLK